MKHLEKEIRQQDMFGSPTTLEFLGAKDGLYQTYSGGIASIILKAFVFWLFTVYFT